MLIQNLRKLPYLYVPLTVTINGNKGITQREVTVGVYALAKGFSSAQDLKVDFYCVFEGVHCGVAEDF